MGAIFDSKPLFDQNVDAVVNSAAKMLGYVIRSCNILRNFKPIISVCYSFILTNLIFSSRLNKNSLTPICLLPEIFII